MRIRKKILFFVIPISILPLIMVGIFSYNSLISGFEEQIFLENQQLCHLAATNIEHLLDECRDGILLVSSILSTKFQKRQLITEYKNHIFPMDSLLTDVSQQLVMRYSPYLTIRFVSADGYEIFSEFGMKIDTTVNTILDNSNFLKAVSVSVQNRSPIQFPPAEKSSTEQSMSMFSVPLYDKDVLIGFIFLDLDLKLISKIFKDVSHTVPGEYLLMDGNSNLLASGGTISGSIKTVGDNFQSFLKLVYSNSNQLFIHDTFNGNGTQYFSSARVVKEYMAFREPAPEENWYLILIRSETPLLAVFRQSRLIFFIVLLGGLLLAVIGTFFISKKITNPITGLSTAANKIATGNLDIIIHKNSNDEVGDLSDNLNKMTSDLKRLIEQVKANESLAAIGKFSASLTHDLRNPVEGLKLLSAELLNRVQQNQSEYKVADAIHKSVNRLSSLINQSLDFARLNKPIIAQTDLKMLTDDVLQDFNFDSIDFIKNYDESLIPIEADSAQIKRVISNLIRNSFDACIRKRSTSKCRIVLSIRNSDDRIIIELSDTGSGIPAEVMERIFEPFYTTKPDGHGLGLSFARQIISNHNGTIDIESIPEEGTTITIELPKLQGANK
ncbi:MAG: ATP-binding protein [bacterium]